MDEIEGHVRRTVADLVDVTVIDCDPALADTADFCAAYGYAMEDSANAILVAGKSDPPVYAVCVVLATTRLDVNRVVRRRLGIRKASFAPADLTAEITGMAMGGVTPFALPGDAAVDRPPSDGAGTDRRRRREPERQGRRPAGDAARRRRSGGRRRSGATGGGRLTARRQPDDMTASTSISAFHRGSSKAATTTVVFVGRTSANSSPWTADTSVKSDASTR